jgi:hypothetical protein
MCCFSRPVRFVGGTRIFARPAENGRQFLAYSMNVELDEELAMVLPLPVPPSSPDDAVAFIDLEGYEKLFDDLDSAFPRDYGTQPAARGGPFRSMSETPKLVVHDVGMFEASFVPTRAAFARLDPRFRMADGVWDRLPAYADYGFAVFRLKPKKKGVLGHLGLGSSRERIHPMAFSFPRRDEDSLFFPTVHVHDGADVPARASFDHMLFCQADGVLDATLAWTRSSDVLGRHVDPKRAKGLVDGARHGHRASILGDGPNSDVFLRPPSGVALEDLSGRGDTFSYAVRAGAAYMREAWDEMRDAWMTTSRTKLPALCRVLRQGLPALLDARRDEWALTTLDARDDTLAPHFMNGPCLWSGTDYTNGSQGKAGGRGRVAMKIFTKRVEQQDITVAFERLPDQRTLDRIREALEALVDRAAE